MIRSEILQEKDKTQARLSEECTSIHDYLAKSHIAAEKIAESYGFPLRYADLPLKKLKPTAPPPIRYGESAA